MTEATDNDWRCRNENKEESKWKCLNGMNKLKPHHVEKNTAKSEKWKIDCPLQRLALDGEIMLL